MRLNEMQHHGGRGPRRHSSCNRGRIQTVVVPRDEGQNGGTRGGGAKGWKQEGEDAQELHHSAQLHAGERENHYRWRSTTCSGQNGDMAHGSSSPGDGENHMAGRSMLCREQKSRRGQSHLGCTAYMPLRWLWPLQPKGRGRDWMACRANRRIRCRERKHQKATPGPGEGERQCGTMHRRLSVPAGAILIVALLAAVSVPCTSGAEFLQGGRQVLSEPDGLLPRVGGLRGRIGVEAWPEQSAADPLSGPRDLKPEQCLNTLQGRTLVSDDRGFTCKRWDLNFRTGCCTTGNQSKSVHLRVSSKSLLVFPRTQVLPLSASSSPPSLSGRFSCATCNLTHRCCAVYEYCVSCCLDPERTPASLALATQRARQVSAAMFGSVFEFCTTQCRHNSKSVVHENAYISELHHCFALPRAPPGPGSATSAPQAPFEQLGRTVKPVVAAQAVSCDDACAKQNMRCDPGFLHVLNNCSVMHQYVACRGGCLYSAGPDQPAEVVDLAPPRQQPGACMLNTNTALFSCAGAHDNTRRLCPCRDWLS